MTRHRAGSKVDPYSGQSVRSWATWQAVTIDGWGIDDSKTADPVEVGRDQIVTDFVLYRDEVADVAEGDRVVVRGLLCDVVGRPATWHHPMTGWAAGFVVRANIVEG